MTKRKYDAEVRCLRLSAGEMMIWAAAYASRYAADVDGFRAGGWADKARDQAAHSAAEYAGHVVEQLRESAADFHAGWEGLGYSSMLRDMLSRRRT
jgi:hypothetical protein